MAGLKVGTVPARRDLSINGALGPFTVAIESAMVERFGRLIGDTNPAHLDAAYARSKGFPGAIAHSAIGTSAILRMLARALGAWPVPGDEIEIAYIAPVLVGDTLTARGLCTVEAVDAWQAECWCENQDGKKVLTASVRIGRN